MNRLMKFAYASRNNVPGCCIALQVLRIAEAAVAPFCTWHAEYMQLSLTTPLNNSNKTIYDKLQALPFNSLVKSNEYKLLFKTLTDFNCCYVYESEFQ
jgi:hypothetical protein